MATTSNLGSQKPANTPKRASAGKPGPANRSARKPANASRSTARKPGSSNRPTAHRTASRTTSTEPRTAAGQAQLIAERAMLVPVGATLVARENLVSAVRGLTTKYRSRSSLEREIKRYERRGATARNRFERQVRRTQTRFERELRQRRNRVDKLVADASKRVPSVS